VVLSSVKLVIFIATCFGLIGPSSGNICMILRKSFENHLFDTVPPAEILYNMLLARKEGVLLQFKY
jgi:hypothetical protein